MWYLAGLSMCNFIGLLMRDLVGLLPGEVVVDVGPCWVVDVGHGGVAGGVADGEHLLGLLM